jgi:hypothetical protein
MLDPLKDTLLTFVQGGIYCHADSIDCVGKFYEDFQSMN